MSESRNEKSAKGIARHIGFYFKCDYCGLVSESSGKCSNCGAMLVLKRSYADQTQNIVQAEKEHSVEIAAQQPDEGNRLTRIIVPIFVLLGIVLGFIFIPMFVSGRTINNLFAIGITVGITVMFVSLAYVLSGQSSADAEDFTDVQSNTGENE